MAMGIFIDIKENSLKPYKDAKQAELERLKAEQEKANLSDNLNPM